MRRRHRTARLLRQLVEARLARSVDEVTGSAGFDAAVLEVADGAVDPYAAVDALLAP